MYRSRDGVWRDRKETPAEYRARRGIHTPITPRFPTTPRTILDQPQQTDWGVVAGVCGVLGAIAVALFGGR